MTVEIGERPGRKAALGFPADVEVEVAQQDGEQVADGGKGAPSPETQCIDLSSYYPTALPRPKGDLAELEAFLDGPLLVHAAPWGNKLHEADVPQLGHGVQECTPLTEETLGEVVGKEAESTETSSGGQGREGSVVSQVARSRRAHLLGDAARGKQRLRNCVAADSMSGRKPRGSRGPINAGPKTLLHSDLAEDVPVIDDDGDIPIVGSSGVNVTDDETVDLASESIDATSNKTKANGRHTASPRALPAKRRTPMKNLRPVAVALSSGTALGMHGGAGENTTLILDGIRPREARVSLDGEAAENNAKGHVSSELSSVPDIPLSSVSDASYVSPKFSPAVSPHARGSTRRSGRLVVSEVVIESTPRRKSARLRSSAPEPETPLRLDTPTWPEPEAPAGLKAAETASAQKSGQRKPRVSADRSLGDPLFESTDANDSPFTRTTRSKGRPISSRDPSK